MQTKWELSPSFPSLRRKQTNLSKGCVITNMNWWIRSKSLVKLMARRHWIESCDLMSLYRLYSLDKVWRKYGTCAQNGSRHSPLPRFFLYFFRPTTVSTLLWICVYIKISDCVGIVYELPFLQNNTASEIFLHKSGAVGSVSGYSSLRAGLAMTGRICDIGENVWQYSGYSSLRAGLAMTGRTCDTGQNFWQYSF